MDMIGPELKAATRQVPGARLTKVVLTHGSARATIMMRVMLEARSDMNNISTLFMRFKAEMQKMICNMCTFDFFGGTVN